MGNKDLGQESDGIEKNKASYKVIAFKGKELPDQYLNLILASWLNSLRDGNKYFKRIYSWSYYKNYEIYIRSILARPSAIVNLAVLCDDNDVALGWSIIENNTLHYAHVKRDLRHQGIFKSLCTIKIKIITHLTRDGFAFWYNKHREAIFDPFYQEEV